MNEFEDDDIIPAGPDLPDRPWEPDDDEERTRLVL
jgi:hypothetical protein